MHGPAAEQLLIKVTVHYFFVVVVSCNKKISCGFPHGSSDTNVTMQGRQRSAISLAGNVSV